MVVPRWRYIGAAVAVLFTLHLVLSIHPTYRANTSSSFGFLPSSWGSGEQWSGSQSPTAQAHYAPGMPNPEELRAMVDAKATSLAERKRVKATFVVLARNSDLADLLSSMKQMEDRFNYWAQYDWVFLNDDDFTDEFKRYTQALTSSTCKYGKIPADHWHQPDWIDEEKAKASREEMIRKKVIYGHSVPYRNMCRFNSGFFYHHPILADYDYYWRVEPDVKFFCDLNYDPFLLMKEQGKVYGFTLSLYEYLETIPTLWDATKEFMAENPDLIPKDNAMSFVSDDGGETYNKCHFWSNFEIGDLNFWRGEAYTKYFEFLDKKGGFYYERWGDAPVHSLGVALFAKKEQIHWFDDIGYRHNPFQHCPQGDAHTRGKCWCDPSDNFDFEWYSCTKRFVDMTN